VALSDTDVTMLEGVGFTELVARYEGAFSALEK
jgi:hypothetical protein